jgi:hypothetical protein
MFTDKMTEKDNHNHWQEALARTRSIATNISKRRGGGPLTPTPEDVIREMRQERDEQLQQHLP